MSYHIIRGRKYKRVGKTEFKYVSKCVCVSGMKRDLGKILYYAQYTGYPQKNQIFKNAREAAKFIDLHLIDIGKRPVNILKPVKK